MATGASMCVVITATSVDGLVSGSSSKEIKITSLLILLGIIGMYIWTVNNDKSEKESESELPMILSFVTLVILAVGGVYYISKS